jgi:two-component system phosphate regulon response regulator PhoB/two-component system alkaline phosphatase synthesis response regulator PhoP
MIDKNLIAILDDEIDILELIAINLKKSGFNPVKFDTPQKFFEFLKKSETKPCLIILDLMLPEQDGFEITKILKNTDELKNIPIIMLTAKDEIIDKIVGLELGADDYITKPFSVKELVVRIKVILKRVYKNFELENVVNENILKNDILINKEKHEVFVDNKKIDLTMVEFKILDLLMSKKGNVFSREKILYYLWEEDKAVVDRTVDVHIRNLRKKLSKHAEKIKNIRGMGYKFVE